MSIEQSHTVSCHICKAGGVRDGHKAYMRLLNFFDHFLNYFSLLVNAAFCKNIYFHIYKQNLLLLKIILSFVLHLLIPNLFRRSAQGGGEKIGIQSCNYWEKKHCHRQDQDLAFNIQARLSFTQSIPVKDKKYIHHRYTIPTKVYLFLMMANYSNLCIK